MVYEAVRAQQRALEMAQGWSESVLGTLKEQAESYGNLLHWVDASLRSMEQAVKSQAESTKAMAEGLRGARNVVSAAISTQQHSVERVETFVGSIVDVLNGQLEALRTQVEIGQGMLSDPIGAQSDVFLRMTRVWMDAYGRLLSSAPTSVRRERKA